MIDEWSLLLIVLGSSKGMPDGAVSLYCVCVCVPEEGGYIVFVHINPQFEAHKLRCPKAPKQ